MRTTLLQAKHNGSGIARAIGINPCDARFVEILNAAQQRLSEMGKWWGTYRRLHVCLTAQCITWPREVATVEGLQVCRVGVPLLNEWYDFGEEVRAPNPDDNCNLRMLMDRGLTCQFTDIASTAYIRIYPTVAADAGAKVLLQGLDGNGNPIRTLVAGVYVDGEQVTLAAPFATSLFQFKGPGLTGVQKPVTKGRLNVFMVDPSTGVETKIAFWEPSELNPSYRRSFLTQLPTCTTDVDCQQTSNGCASMTYPSCSNIVAESIVRLEFIPALVDSDWLFIGNLYALKRGMKAAEKEDKNQYQEAELEWASAVRILRAEAEKYTPYTKTRVNAQPMGTAPLSRVFAGMN